MLIAKRHTALLEAQTQTHTHRLCYTSVTNIHMMLCNSSVYIKMIFKNEKSPIDGIRYTVEIGFSTECQVKSLRLTAIYHSCWKMRNFFQFHQFGGYIDDV